MLRFFGVLMIFGSMVACEKACPVDPLAGQTVVDAGSEGEGEGE